MNESENESLWYFPAQVVKIADGEYRVKAGKPIQRARAELVSRMTGLPIRTLHHLAERGKIRCERVSKRLSFFYPAEVEAFLRGCDDFL